MASELWARNVLKAQEGQEGPEMVKQKTTLASDKLHDTHRFQGLMTASQYKRRRDDVMVEVAKTDGEVRKEVLRRDDVAKAKAIQERAAREAEKSRRLKEETQEESSKDTATAPTEEASKKTKKSKKERKKAAAAASGLSFDAGE